MFAVSCEAKTQLPAAMTAKPTPSSVLRTYVAKHKQQQQHRATSNFNDHIHEQDGSALRLLSTTVSAQQQQQQQQKKREHASKAADVCNILRCTQLPAAMTAKPTPSSVLRTCTPQHIPQQKQKQQQEDNANEMRQQPAVTAKPSASCVLRTFLPQIKCAARAAAAAAAAGRVGYNQQHHQMNASEDEAAEVTRVI
jgi:hypothetical protein